MKRSVLAVALAMVALFSTVAMAKSTTVGNHESNPELGLGVKAVGVAVGFVSPENTDGVFSLGAFADCGMITPDIGVEARLDYWSHSESDFGVDASVSDVTLGARGKYHFQVQNPNIHPFAGAGLGLHFLNAEVVVPPSGGNPAMKASDSTTRLGLDIGGGISTSISPRADFLGELWYGIVSDASQLSLRFGLSYKLGS